MHLEKAYRVGGYVRDTLLGLKPMDVDWVVIDESPESMKAKGFTQVGAFPKFIHPVTGDDYALGRSKIMEVTESGDFLYEWRGVTLEDDLKRRDLTINAMAMMDDGRIVDPANGQEDLRLGVLRHVDHESFLEDPLRILRVARFAARFDFPVAPETMHLMSRMVADGMLASVKAERVWQETEKALLEVTPRNYFEVLDQCGALEVIFPELHRLKGIPQRADYHAEGDAYVHTLMVVDEATIRTRGHEKSRKLRIRMAGLLHDLGKANTAPDLLWHPDGSVRGNHYGHESSRLFKAPLNALAKRILMPNDVRSFAYRAGLGHQQIHQVQGLGAKGMESLFELLDLDRVLRHDVHFLADLVTFCEADQYGRRTLNADGSISKPTSYPQGKYFLEAMKPLAELEVGPVFLASVAKSEAQAERRKKPFDKAKAIADAKIEVRAARRSAARRFLGEVEIGERSPGR